MKMLIIRLDDASERMNLKNWERMEKLLDKYSIKPIVGVIPDSKDPDFMNYERVGDFWRLVNSWEKKNWIIALHGYQHVFCSREGGINPINNKSEFAGISLENQKEKIRAGYQILKKNGINPKVFFAPAHTFDLNTLKALKEETSIRIISDTIANDIYYKDEFYFIPQQSGKCRRLPFSTITFCYHPNSMLEKDFEYLESFLKTYKSKFDFSLTENIKKRKYSFLDRILKTVYFLRKRGNKNDY